MVLLDTLKASRRLQAAGFPEAQADELVATFSDDFGQNLATKDDIALVRGELEVLRGETGVLRGELEVVRGELEVVRGEIRDESRKLQIRMYLGLGALAGLTLAGISIATTVLLSVLG